MDPWRLTIQQTESGYADYRFILNWQSPKPCPPGVKKVIVSVSSYPSVVMAEKFALELKESLPS